MKSESILITLSMICLFSTFNTDVKAQSDSIKISGYVHNILGCHPIDSVVISIINRRGRPVDSTFTDASGYYTITMNVKDLQQNHTFLAVHKKHHYPAFGKVRYKSREKYHRDFEIMAFSKQKVKALAIAKKKREEKFAGKRFTWIRKLD